MMSNYRQTIADFIRHEALPIEKYGHQPRLYALAVQCGFGQQYDDDVLYAAAWLHDIGVFLGHRPENPDELSRWDNVIYAVEKAPAILESAGFPSASIPRVLEAIQSHQPSGDPTTMEGIILRDADMLEQLGAVAVLRTVCKVGRDTRFHTFSDAVANLRKAHDTLPRQLRLSESRRLAERKIARMRDFLDGVEEEAQGALF